VLVFGCFYTVIRRETKEKQRNVFQTVKGKHSRIREIDKSISRIKKSIDKDRDESSLGLEDFDAKLKTIESELTDIAGTRKRTTVEFDSDVKNVITKQIADKYDSDITKAAAQLGQKKTDIDSTQSAISLLERELTNTYEPFIGKGNLNLTVINALESLIATNDAATIGDALRVYESRSASAGNK
jgi:hypothetical protein